ncbi:MAG: adenylate kinase family protein [Phycisphaerales bacterium]|nr:nucleoside monophosphate kinase [Phycisphaerales bacterium]
MAERVPAALLFGAPGAGKGTQGKILGQVPGFYHLSCGEVFRTLDIHSDLGRTFYEYSSKGELVPDDVTVAMWKENLHAQVTLSIYKPHAEILVLDGIPRNVKQAELLEEHIDVKAIVHLVCRDMSAMLMRLRKRALRENRADDAREEVIRRRWEVYEHETRPVLDFYSPDLIHEVDAIGTPVQVLIHTMEALAPIHDELFGQQEMSGAL